MSGGAWYEQILDWPWASYTTAAVLALSGLLLGWWALLGDRARGRRRCPKCWYDLRGTPGLRCSECGYEARRERKLHKSRRRWGWAGLAVLFVTGGAVVGMLPKARRDGWLSFVPTFVLLRAAPKIADQYRCDLVRPYLPTPVESELIKRASAESLTATQWRYLLESGGVLVHRARWPAEVELHIGIRQPLWLLQSGNLSFQLRDSTIGTRDRGASPAGGFIGYVRKLGQYSAGTRGVDLNCTIDSRVAILGGGSVTLAVDQISLPIVFVEALDQAIAPVRGADIDELIRMGLRIEAVPASEGGFLSRGAHICAYLNRALDPQLEEIAFGFTVALVQDGQEWMGAQLPPGTDPLLGAKPGESSMGSCIVPGLKDRSLDSPAFVQECSIRVRGDGRIALRDWDKPKYWDGEFTVPIGEIVRKAAP